MKSLLWISFSFSFSFFCFCWIMEFWCVRWYRWGDIDVRIESEGQECWGVDECSVMKENDDDWKSSIEVEEWLRLGESRLQVNAKKLIGNWKQNWILLESDIHCYLWEVLEHWDCEFGYEILLGSWWNQGNYIFYSVMIFINP